MAFHHKGRDLSLVVHGDDFTFAGFERDLDWAEGQMKSWYQVKVRARLGPDESDDKEATLLGRIIKWHRWGISCRSDPKYRRYVMAALGLSDESKSLSTTGSKDAADGGGPRDWGDDKQYRSLVASVNYMATDQPDLQFACKEACREMASPSEGAWIKLKRMGRYLVGRLEVIWRYPWKQGHGGWRVWVDSDWAGDEVTRRSTSGGIIALGSHCVKTWSSTQSVPALSSCEAEYLALVDGASRVLGLQAAARELGIVVEDVAVETATDSSAAKSYASRRGVGKVRHMEVRHLWLQQAVAEGRFRLIKVDGATNPADVLTKYKGVEDFRRLLSAVGVEVVAKGRGGKDGWIRLGPGERWADAE